MYVFQISVLGKEMLVNFYQRASPAWIEKGEKKTKEQEMYLSKSEKTFLSFSFEGYRKQKGGELFVVFF